ncbi:MAG: hypothetical protein HOW73_21425 [Polyangiaceae bacterium]|nr:hypothetical protein [Polyangiaceae bacterium]
MRTVLRVLAASCCAVLLACSFDEQDQANKNIMEANELLKAAEGMQVEAFDLHEAAFKAMTIEAVKENASKCVKKFDDAADNYDRAAKLAEDASKLKVQKIVAEYYDLKRQQFVKDAELARIDSKLCKSAAESGTKEKLLADRDAVEKERNTLVTERNELNERAEKMRETNASAFQK